ncbi:unnamed protein product [Euphydryas editha]|uniref:Reverse transcriptase n=1 Tax=Euphydryas editha TaxID=104508 RepID=A0AAU9UNB1_EUPED|nr:unnamed protein product [Euphydryas editha]
MRDGSKPGPSGSSSGHVLDKENDGSSADDSSYEELATLKTLLNFPEEVAFRLTDTEYKIFYQIDILAKEASCDDVSSDVLPFFTDCIYLVKEHCSLLWKVHFDERSVEKGIWYRTLQNEPWKSPWFEAVNINRNTLITAFRLRSGHIPLHKFGFLMKKVASPLCSECRMVEDVYHIMLECVRNNDIRSQIVRKIEDLMNTGTFNRILAYPLAEEVKEVYKMVGIALSRRKVL